MVLFFFFLRLLNLIQRNLPAKRGMRNEVGHFRPNFSWCPGRLEVERQRFCSVAPLALQSTTSGLVE